MVLWAYKATRATRDWQSGPTHRKPTKRYISIHWLWATPCKKSLPRSITCFGSGINLHLPRASILGKGGGPLKEIPPLETILYLNQQLAPENMMVRRQRFLSFGCVEAQAYFQGRLLVFGVSFFRLPAVTLRSNYFSGGCNLTKKPLGISCGTGGRSKYRTWPLHVLCWIDPVDSSPFGDSAVLGTSRRVSMPRGQPNECRAIWLIHCEGFDIVIPWMVH